MAKAYPGVFNGSEMLNALEITKRMAWIYGGAAESIGILPASEGERCGGDGAARLSLRAMNCKSENSFSTIA